MASNPTSTFTPPPNPSQPGTSQWLYDEIMRHIEPDLVTTMLPRHIDMYAKESQKERVARMKAYDEAFAVFDKVAAEFEQEFHHDVQRLKTDAREKAMTEEKKKEKNVLEKIEDEMGDA